MKFITISFNKVKFNKHFKQPNLMLFVWQSAPHSVFEMSGCRQDTNFKPIVPLVTHGFRSTMLAFRHLPFYAVSSKACPMHALPSFFPGAFLQFFVWRIQDLENPVRSFYVKFSLLRTTLWEIVLHTYRRAGLYHVTSVDVRKRTVIRRIFGIRERTADLS